MQLSVEEGAIGDKVLIPDREQCRVFAEKFFMAFDRR
jgi:hypothetical protein